MVLTYALNAPLAQLALQAVCIPCAQLSNLGPIAQPILGTSVATSVMCIHNTALRTTADLPMGSPNAIAVRCLHCVMAYWSHSVDVSMCALFPRHVCYQFLRQRLHLLEVLMLASV
eukprot:4672725-Amphidinium_carterae.2